MREVGWLIERGDSTTNGPIWWTGTTVGNRIGPWSPDANEAVRFCREQDAATVAASMLFDFLDNRRYGELRVTEHIWVNHA